MVHITNVLIHSNRCEILDGHVFEKGDKGFPHIRLKFLYKFGLESLQNKNLECKFILPDKTYTTTNIVISEKDEVLFPIHYSVFTKTGWSILKIALTEENNRITLDDIIIKVKNTQVGDIYQNENIQHQIKLEISKKVKEITDEGEKQKKNLIEVKTEILNAINLKKEEQINSMVETAVNNALGKLKSLDLRTVWEGKKSEEGVVCTLPENWKICFVNTTSDEEIKYPIPKQYCFTNKKQYEFIQLGDLANCELLNNQIKINYSLGNIYINKVEVLM